MTFVPDRRSAGYKGHSCSDILLCHKTVMCTPCTLINKSIWIFADYFSRILNWISGFQIAFLDFWLDFWISQWISEFQLGFLNFSLDFWISGFQSRFLDFSLDFCWRCTRFLLWQASDLLVKMDVDWATLATVCRLGYSIFWKEHKQAVLEFAVC